MEWKKLEATCIEEIPNVDIKDILYSLNRVIRNINAEIDFFETKTIFESITLDTVMTEDNVSEIDVSNKSFIPDTITVSVKPYGESAFVELSDPTEYTFSEGIITLDGNIDTGDTLRVVGWGSNLVIYDYDSEFTFDSTLKRIINIFINDERAIETNYDEVKERTDDNFFAMLGDNKVVFSDYFDGAIADEDCNMKVTGLWNIAEITIVGSEIDISDRLENCLEHGVLSELYKMRRYYDKDRFFIYKSEYENLLSQQKRLFLEKEPTGDNSRRYNYNGV